MTRLIDRRPRLTGVVIYHTVARGFGKIRVATADHLEYFFHADACRGYFESLVEGTPVTFSAGEDVGKGPRAVYVHRVAAAAAAETQALDVADTRGNR